MTTIEDLEKALGEAEEELKWTREDEIERRYELDAMNKAIYDAKVAKQKNDRAKQLHENIVALDYLVSALSPEGIQSKIMAQAVGPLNARMAELCAIAGWPMVSLSEDLEPCVSGRPPIQLGESGAWRARTILAAAIAEASDIKIAAFDGFDCLEIEDRARFLYRLLPALKVDAVFATGTLKQEPPDRFNGSAAIYWLAPEGPQA